MKILKVLSSIAALALLSCASSIQAAVVAGVAQPTSVSWNDPSKLTLAQPSASVQSLYLLRGDGNWISGSDITSLLFSNNVISQKVFNSTATAQTPAAATRTYITGSALSVPTTGFQVGTVLRWRFNMTKTAAGTATSTFDVCFGTTGTTTDTAQLTFTKPAGTAAADEGWVEIECVVKSVNASTGVVQGEFYLLHNLSATGHAQIPVVVVNSTSASFNNVSPTFVGVCITSGAADAITINQVSASAAGI